MLVHSFIPSSSMSHPYNNTNLWRAMVPSASAKAIHTCSPIVEKGGWPPDLTCIVAYLHSNPVPDTAIQRPLWLEIKLPDLSSVVADLHSNPVHDTALRRSSWLEIKLSDLTSIVADLHSNPVHDTATRYCLPLWLEIKFPDLTCIVADMHSNPVHDTAVRRRL